MQELTGGIKNALERGENIEQIKQSFINAGYSQRDVNSSVAEIQSKTTATTPPQTPAPQKTLNSLTTNQSSIQPTRNILPSQLKKFPTPKIKTPQKQQRFPGWLIVVIILSIFILVGAALLGFYWDKIVKLFLTLI